LTTRGELVARGELSTRGELIARASRVLDHEPAGGCAVALVLELRLDRVRHPCELVTWQRFQRSQPRLRAVAGKGALILTLMPVNVVHCAAILCARIISRIV